MVLTLTRMKINNYDTGNNLATKEKPKTKKPSMYKVLMLNDDYTPMEFVIEVLEKYFGKQQMKQLK